MDSLESSKKLGVLMNVQAAMDSYGLAKSQGQTPSTADVLTLLNKGDEHMSEMSALAESAKNYKALGGEADLISKGASLIAKLPAKQAAVAGTLVQAVVAVEAAAESRLLGPQAQQSAQQGLLRAADFFNEQGRLTMFAALELASTEPSFRTALDTYLVKYNSITTSTPSDSILASNKTLTTRMLTDDNNHLLKQVLDKLSKGASATDIEALADQFEDLTAASTKTSSELIAIIKDLQNATQSAAARAALEKKEKDAQQQLAHEVADERAAAYLVSTAIGFIDPALGRTLLTASTATINVAEAVRLFSLATSPSSLVLTANVLGATTQIASLFTDSPSEMQIITRELQAIRRQLVALEGAMNSRFDHVDTALNEIYVTVIARTDLLAAQQKYTQLQIDNLRHDLSELRTQLGHLGYDTDRKFRALVSDTHDIRISDCALWRRRVKDTPPPFDTLYYPCLSSFHAWAVQSSFGDVYAGSAPSLVSKDQLTELTTVSKLNQELRSPIQAMPTFLKVVSLLTDGAVVTSRAPDPTIWKIGADSYASFLSDWLSYAVAAKYNSSQDLKEMAHVGVDVENAISQIRGVPEGNNKVTDALLAFYTSALESLRRAVLKPEDDYRTLNGIAQDVDLWLGPRQYTSMEATAPQVGGGPSLPLSQGILTKVRPSAVLVAEKLGLGQSGLYWSLRDANCLEIGHKFHFDGVKAPPQLNSNQWPYGLFTNDNPDPSGNFMLCGLSGITNATIADNWTGGSRLAERFASEAVSEISSSASNGSEVNAAVLNEHRQQAIETVLQHHRQRLIAAMNARFANTSDLLAPALQVDFARTLIVDYLLLAYPVSMQSSDPLHALLSSMPTSDDIIAKYKSVFSVMPAALTQQAQNLAQRKSDFDQQLSTWLTEFAKSVRNGDTNYKAAGNKVVEMSMLAFDHSGQDVDVAFTEANSATVATVKNVLTTVKESSKGIDQTFPWVNETLATLTSFAQLYK